MSTLSLFDTQIGDVTLNAALLTAIQAGSRRLYLQSMTGSDVVFDSVMADAILNQGKSYRFFSSVAGDVLVNADVLNALT